MNENYETTLPETFNPSTEEGSHFDVVPIGSYTAQVVDACVARPQNGNGYYVGLSWQITEGEYENRYVFQNITIQHSNEQATTVGRRQFKDLCVACGIDEQVTNVDVFKFIPCTIRVGIEKDKKQGIYPDKNRVSRILPLEDAKTGPSKSEPKTAPATPTTAAKPETRPAPASAAVGDGSAPWRKPATSKPVSEDLNDEVQF
jgi:Protein of unknown function (DUF669)